MVNSMPDVSSSDFTPFFTPLETIDDISFSSWLLSEDKIDVLDLSKKTMIKLLLLTKWNKSYLEAVLWI